MLALWDPVASRAGLVGSVKVAAAVVAVATKVWGFV